MAPAFGLASRLVLRLASRLVVVLVPALLLAALGARPAAAQVRRYALLVGSNLGQPHETPLRYAESDVQSVADTLGAVGGFPSERIVRLVGASAERVRGALVDLNLAIQQDLRAGGEAILFVYYSGHADAQRLHLGGTELATDELAKLVRLSPAKLKVLLVDACKSGAITRVKGGRQVPRLELGLEDQLRNEGYAIITSSAAGEDAQESDALRSSIFTHHFLTALRGPADANRDLLVTLGEAYAYAYEQALKASLSTVAGTQHATFNYDLRGRADPVLADLRAARGGAQLVLDGPAEYLVLDGATGALLVEAIARGPGTRVLLPPGTLRVRMRTRTAVFETALALRAGETATLEASAMRPVPLAQVVRKGETEARLAHGPIAAGLVHGPLGAGFSPMWGVQLGWALELPRFTLVPRLTLATGSGRRATDDVRAHALREATAELAGLYVFDLGRLSIAPVVSVGLTQLSQQVELRGACGAPGAPCEIRARPRGLVTTVGAWGAVPLGRGFALEGILELASFYLRRQERKDAAGGAAGGAGALTYRASVGVGYRY